MSNLIVNTADADYIRVTNNKGRIGIGTPYIINPENNSEIIVTVSSIQNKLLNLRDRLNKTVSASHGELRRLWEYGGGDNQEDKLVDQFENWMRDTLYPNPSTRPTEVKDTARFFFPYSAAPFGAINESRDYICVIMGEWIRLFEDILNKKSGLSRLPVIPPTVTPTPLPIGWRRCETGVFTETPNIPTEFIKTMYTGTEGGYCYEPVYISIASSSANFQFTALTPSTSTKVFYTFTATSQKRYSVNLSTDAVFEITPSTFTLASYESRIVTASILPQNANSFPSGITNFRLQMNITKL